MTMEKKKKKFVTDQQLWNRNTPILLFSEKGTTNVTSELHFEYISFVDVDIDIRSTVFIYFCKDVNHCEILSRKRFGTIFWTPNESQFKHDRKGKSPHTKN